MYGIPVTKIQIYVLSKMSASIFKTGTLKILKIYKFLTCFLHGAGSLCGRLWPAGSGRSMGGGEEGRGRARLRLEGGQRLAGSRHLLVEAGNHTTSGIVLVQSVRQLLPVHITTIKKHIHFSDRAE
jgi:hypothetical protein